jgi:TRAP-type C4-dicarboxylate transport system substrate-binding protein
VIQVPEIPQMFATGAVHAMITSSATGMSSKAWEFVKNYYNTSAFHPKNVVVVNQRAFSRLPKDQQNALVKSAAAAEKRGWELSKAREKEANEALAKNGMTLHEPDAAMKDAFARIGQQMAAEWEKTAGADGQAILKAYRGK